MGQAASTSEVETESFVFEGQKFIEDLQNLKKNAKSVSLTIDMSKGPAINMQDIIQQQVQRYKA